MRRKFKKGPRSKEMELYTRIYRHRERKTERGSRSGI